MMLMMMMMMMSNHKIAQANLLRRPPPVGPLLALIALLVVCAASCSCRLIEIKANNLPIAIKVNSQPIEQQELSPAEVLRARGFQADELFVLTSAGYKLRITRGRNPLCRNGSGDCGSCNLKTPRDPIIFVHGLISTANIFLNNSHGATPKDFTRSINLVNISSSALNELLRNEPSARSLALLALNFCHEVWLLDRRGAPGSRELAGDPLSLPANEKTTNQIKELSFNADVRYWNYSLDEQARIDFAETIEFVLAQTGCAKVALVTHSAGGAIALMSQSLLPERLAPKISSQIHWAPAYSVGNNNSQLELVANSSRVFLELYVGPLPPLAPSAVTDPTGSLCTQFEALLPGGGGGGSSPLERQANCRFLLNALYNNGGREPDDPNNSEYYPSSSHEFAQLAQQIQSYQPRSMRLYDLGPEGNKRAYKQQTAPAYDLSRVQARANSMSFYVGPKDTRVTPTDVSVTLNQLQVSQRFHLIQDGDFDHGSFFSDANAPLLVIIPSMQELEILAC